MPDKKTKKRFSILRVFKGLLFFLVLPVFLFIGGMFFLGFGFDLFENRYEVENPPGLVQAGPFLGYPAVTDRQWDRLRGNVIRVNSREIVMKRSWFRWVEGRIASESEDRYHKSGWQTYHSYSYNKIAHRLPVKEEANWSVTLDSGERVGEILATKHVHRRKGEEWKWEKTSFSYDDKARIREIKAYDREDKLLSTQKHFFWEDEGGDFLGREWSTNNRVWAYIHYKFLEPGVLRGMERWSRSRKILIDGDNEDFLKSAGYVLVILDGKGKRSTICNFVLNEMGDPIWATGVHLKGKEPKKADWKIVEYSYFYDQKGNWIWREAREVQNYESWIEYPLDRSVIKRDIGYF